MPLQNRVTPLGELIATPERGLVYGNRGRLHDEHRHIRRNYDGRRWIACRLEFRGRRRADPMPPGRYTGLFFLDEVTALAAGHRPCAECRHEDYLRFVDVVGMRAQAADARLHEERLGPHRAQALEDLPDGAFVLRNGNPWLLLGDRMLRWTPGGYAEGRRRGSGRAEVITPPTSLRVLASGWSGSVPLLHPSYAASPVAG
jgi:hypothetical protein